jgi:hypothetical protein
MLFSKLVFPVIGMALAACSATAAPVNCPAFTQVGAVKHALNNASLYDGPPEQMADLIPDVTGNMDKWDLDSVDPYLVCKYLGTTKVLTFHASHAQICEAGGTPFQAYCR